MGSSISFFFLSTKPVEDIRTAEIIFDVSGSVKLTLEELDALEQVATAAKVPLELVVAAQHINQQIASRLH